MSTADVSSVLRVRGGADLAVAGLDPACTLVDEDRARRELRRLRTRLFDLHELMMANERHAMLLVLQGLDCSGKNGTIKHVVDAMNPAGVRVESFTEPVGREREEHFLARIERAAPRPGQLVVFDRSQYEDVFVPAVHDGMDGDEFDARLDDILEFERRLVDRGVIVLKCFLHISYDEQRRRLLRRLDRPDKHWKFSVADVDTRARWSEWEVVYGKALGRTSTERSPWFAIPSEHKWHRNWVVARLLVEHLERLEETHPPLPHDLDVDAVRARLAPPG